MSEIGRSRDPVVTRCFVGLELDGDSRAYLKARVERLYTRFRAMARWPLRIVRPENWHATVLFFPGLTSAERNTVWETVSAGAAAGAWRDTRFDWQDLALWPSLRRPSLVCLEASPYPGAQNWPLGPVLAQMPFAKGETQHYSPFRPHITVIRFDRRWRKLLVAGWASAVAELPPLEPERIRFDRIAFFLSTLTPEQPIYPREQVRSIG